MSPNEACQLGQNLLGRGHWVLAGTPRPKIVGFCDLVGVAIAPVSKKLAVKYFLNLDCKYTFVCICSLQTYLPSNKDRNLNLFPGKP